MTREYHTTEAQDNGGDGERGIWHVTKKDGTIIAMTTYKKYAWQICAALNEQASKDKPAFTSNTGDMT